MTEEQKKEFLERINSVTQNDKGLFGKMNVNQMIVHCTDQIRMALGEIEGLYRQNVDMKKIREMAARGESVSTVDGLDQTAGQGTKPTEFENDKKILVEYLERFVNTGSDFSFHFHPFLGEMNKESWNRLVIYHLNHHLKQFGR